MNEPPGAACDALRDEARFRLALVVGMTIALVIFAVGSALQPALLELSGDVPTGERLFANFAGIVALLLGAWFVPLYRLPWSVRVGALVVLCVLAGVVRAVVQVALDIYSMGAMDRILLDMVAPAITTAFSVAVGLAFAEYQDRVRRYARRGAQQELVAASALEALRTEELRVRRSVAEGLHGTVQQKLVVLQMQLRQAIGNLSRDDPSEREIARDLERVEAGLNRLREQDVRDLSRVLYPGGVDLGLVQAARILIRQLPSSIAVSTRIDDSLIGADDPGKSGLPADVRLLAIRVIEEAITNALRHGRAERLQIELLVDAQQVLQIIVDDDGAGIPPGSDPSGVRLLGERLAEHGGSLSLTRGSLGGARLAATLPLPANEEALRRSA